MSEFASFIYFAGTVRKLAMTNSGHHGFQSLNDKTVIPKYSVQSWLNYRLHNWRSLSDGQPIINHILHRAYLL